MITLKNNTKSVSKIGHIVALDPLDSGAFVYVTNSATKAIGVITEAVSYRKPCKIATIGEKTRVMVSNNAVKGDIIRATKSTDRTSIGVGKVVKPNDAPYLKIGEALIGGAKLVPCILELTYIPTDSMKGATVWDDLRVPSQNTKLNPTKSEPAFEEFADGLFTYKFDTSNADDESVHFIAQMPHSYKEGSDIYPHIHWSPDSTDTGNVVWQFEYVIANIYGTFAGAATSDEITIAADGTALKHQMDHFTTIDGTGLTISHIIICRLTRMSATDADDTFTGNACFLEFDFHYEKDTMGSRTELAK